MKRFLSLLLPLVLTGATGCSLGQGLGDVRSDKLFARDCWTDAYDMLPDFFAANPYRNTETIRVQRGTDLEEVSDGLDVLVDDIPAVEQAIQNAADQHTDDFRFAVALPVGLHAPGTPILPPKPTIGTVQAPGTPQAPIIHMALYLQRSCHNQNTILYAVSGTIQFASIFDGDRNERDAAKKYTSARFDVQMGDPGDAPFGAQADEIPRELQSRVTGNFQFYFERGQPGQPFP